MVELGELEKRHADFDKRNVRIYAVSNDDVELSKKTQEKFPHLKIASDADLKMAAALHVIHKDAGHDGKDTNAATTILTDGAGKVRWFFRADRFMERISPDALLAAIDERLTSSSGSQ